MLNYFDKGLLRKFRRIVRISADFQDGVVDSVLVFDDQPGQGRRIPLLATANQNRIINTDIVQLLLHDGSLRRRSGPTQRPQSQVIMAKLPPQVNPAYRIWGYRG